MNKIEFQTSAAQKIYNDYMSRIARNISALDAKEKSEILMEFNSHIFEGTRGSNANNEVDRLLELTGKLGAPEEFLIPLIADKKLQRAVRTFNPRDVFNAIRLNLTNGFIYSIFGLMYLLLFSFAFIIVSKIIFPMNTGLFFKDGSFQGFGFLRETSGMCESLGFWIIPASLLAAVVLYLGITMLLRLQSKK